MTYSCAYFATPQTTLDDAQRAKYDLICRKLGLGPGSRLLDVGCGWGGMALHAAQHYGARVVGVTLSQRQARVRAPGRRRGRPGRSRRDPPAGLPRRAGRALRRHLQHRHVRARRRGAPGRVLRLPLPPAAAGRPAAQSRHLPAARQPRPQPPTRSSAATCSRTANCTRSASSRRPCRAAASRCATSQSLREHYALTLRPWVDAPGGALGRGGRLVGAGRARVWRLYMAGSAENFARANLTIHQLLAVRPRPGGASDMPLTRDAFLI